jgi:hypothetical protein
MHSIFPEFGINQVLSWKAATHWMFKIGYCPQEHCKCIYFDGHERPNVFKARKKYIEHFDLYQKRSQIYGSDNLDMAAQVDLKILGDLKEMVFIFHDESIIHAKEKEKPKSTWPLPGTTKI